MPSREIISTPNAPAAVGSYSQCTKANGVLYLSGQIGLVPGTGAFVSDDVVGQAQQCMNNILAVLEAGGSSIDSVLKMEVLLADINDFSKVDAVYRTYFNGEFPARACYQAAALPKAALIEIVCTALVEE
ncbi:hypothetical protein PCE1_000428 [Barthelona sp. PCE]